MLPTLGNAHSPVKSAGRWGSHVVSPDTQDPRTPLKPVAPPSSRSMRKGGPVRELIRQDEERRLGNLEQELIAAAKGPKIEIPLAEIRRKGLIPALREHAR
jgi:hypothetical protein